MQSFMHLLTIEGQISKERDEYSAVDSVYLYTIQNFSSGIVFIDWSIILYSQKQKQIRNGINKIQW